MKAIPAAILGVMLMTLGTAAQAQDDNAKKLVGVWVVDKSSGDLPAGSTVEFTKDGKLKVAVKADGQELKFDGTFKVEKDKIMIKLMIDTQNLEESITIKKLTDEVLEIEDKDSKVDTFKKKKS